MLSFAVCKSLSNVCVWLLLLHSCQWPYVSASWVPGVHMLSWPCGLHLETPRLFPPMHSPLPPSLPSLPPSTTLWSTCCASPTFENVSTETHLCYDRGSTGEAHSQTPKNASDPPHSAARTWASPRASQMDSKTAMGRVWTALKMLSCVMWPPPKGLPASWLAPPTERWQSASSQSNHRLMYSSGTTSCFHEANKTGQILNKTREITGQGGQNNKGPAQVIMCHRECIARQYHSRARIASFLKVSHKCPHHCEKIPTVLTSSKKHFLQNHILVMFWWLFLYQLVSRFILMYSSATAFWRSRKWGRTVLAAVKVNQAKVWHFKGAHPRWRTAGTY